MKMSHGTNTFANVVKAVCSTQCAAGVNASKPLSFTHACNRNVEQVTDPWTMDTDYLLKKTELNNKWGNHELYHGLTKSKPTGTWTKEQDIDMDFFVYCKDVALRFVKQKRIPFAKPPQELKKVLRSWMNKNNSEVEILATFWTYFSEERSDPNATFSYVTGGGYSRKFKYGNYEAVLRVIRKRFQKHVDEVYWPTPQKRKYHSEKWIWQTVLTPAIYHILCDIQDELNGAAKWEEKKLRDQENIYVKVDAVKAESQLVSESPKVMTVVSESLDVAQKQRAKKIKSRRKKVQPIVDACMVVAAEMILPSEDATLFKQVLKEERKPESHPGHVFPPMPTTAVWCESLESKWLEASNKCQAKEEVEVDDFETNGEAAMQLDLEEWSPEQLAVWEESRRILAECLDYLKEMHGLMEPPCSEDECDEESKDQYDPQPTYFHVAVAPQVEATEQIVKILQQADPYGALGCHCFVCTANFLRRHPHYCHYEYLVGDDEEEIKEVFTPYELEYTQASEQSLEAVETVTSEANLTFIDERPSESDTLHMSQEVATKDLHRDMAESPWNMSELFSREIIIKTGKWKIDEVAGKIYEELPFPKCITDKGNSFLTSQLRLYGFLRAGVSFRIQLNGTRFHNGRMLAALLPLMYKEDRDAYPYTSFVNWPHSFLDASLSNTVTLHMPFTHLLSHWPTRNGLMENDDTLASLGRLVLVVFNQLRAGASAPTELSYTIYAKMDDPQVHLPVWPVSTFSFSNGLVTQGSEEGWWKSIFSRGLGTALGAFLKTATGGLASGISTTIAGLLFDKPLEVIPPPPMLNRSVDPLCFGAGLDHSTRLSLCPVSQTETTVNTLGGTNGDFNLKTLCSIYSHYNTVTWNEADEAGKLLTWMVMSPCSLNSNKKVSSSYSNRYEPTMLAYICRAFAYWRGNLRVKLQFVSTDMHSGRVAVVYDPSWCYDISGRPTDIDTLMNLNTVIIDIQEKKEVEIEIPYMSIRPWMRAQHFSIAAVSADKYLGQSHIGSLEIYILNKLVAPSNVAQSVDVNIFICAGEGFDLGVPCPTFPLRFVEGQAPYEVGPYANVVPDRAEDPEFPGSAYYKSLYWMGYNFYINGLIKNGKDKYWYNQVATAAGYLRQDVHTWKYEVAIALQNKNAVYLQWANTIAWYETLSNQNVRGEEDGKAFLYFPEHQHNVPGKPFSHTHQFTTDENGKLLSIDSWNPDSTVTASSGVLYKELTNNIATKERAPIDKIKAHQYYAQSAQSWLSSRQDGPAVINILKDSSTREIAPTTLSENAMNLQTVLRRFYCMFSSRPIHCANYFTLVRVPVSPTAVIESYPATPFNVANVNNHNIAWFARLFTYWRGGLRYKFVFKNKEMEVYTWHVPTECESFGIQDGITEDMVQKYMSYAGVAAVSHLQAAVEVEVPFYSAYNQLLIDVHHQHQSLLSQNGTLYCAFRHVSSSGPGVMTSPLTFSIFISTADDFILNVIRPPSLVYEQFGAYYYGYFSNQGDLSAKWLTANEHLVVHGHNESTITRPGKTGKVSGDPVITDAVNTVYWFPGKEKEKEDHKAIEETAQAGYDLFGIGETKAKLDQALDNVNHLATQFNQVLDVSDNNPVTAHIKENLSDIMTKYTILTAEVVTCGAIIHSINQIIRDPQITHFISLAIATAGLVGLSCSQGVHDLIKGVVRWTFSLPSEEIGALPRAQALDGELADVIDNHASIIAAIVAVLGTIFYAYIFDVLPDFNKIKNAIKEFFSTPEDEKEEKAQGFPGLAGGLRNAHFSLLGITALEKVYEKIIKLVNDFISWLLDKENPAVVAARNASQYQERIMAVVTELDDLNNEYVFIEALSDPFVHNRFYKLQSEINDLTDIITKEKLDIKVMQLLMECRRRCRDLITRLEREQLKNPVRYDPFVICLHGETGVGKTKLMYKIAQEVQKIMDLPDYNLIYTKNISDKYWSGYKNQPIVFWDEFLQNREADETVAEFMVLKGNSPVAVNMAALEDKGRYFTSQCIIMTTNRPYATVDSIRDNEAFFRRRQFMLSMMKRDAEQNLDLAASTDYPNWEHCNFVRTEARRNVVHTRYANGNLQEALTDLRTELTNWHQKQLDIIQNEKIMEVLPRGVVIVPQVEITPEEQDEAVAAFAQLDTEPPVLRGNDGNVLRVQIAPPIEHAQGLMDWLPGTSTQPAIVDMQQMGAGAVHGLERHFYRKRDNITEDEEFEAELFLNRAHEFTTDMHQRYIKQYYAKSKRVVSKFVDLAKNMFSNLKNKVVTFFQNHPRIAKVLGITTLLVGLGTVLYMTGHSKGNPINPADFTENAYEASPHKPHRVTIKPENAYESSPVKPRQVVLKAEGSTDPVALDIMLKIHKSVGLIQWIKANRTLSMHCLQLRGRLILAPYHFFSRIEPGSMFQVILKGMNYECYYDPSLLAREGTNDWALYECSARVQSGKDLVRYFVYEKDLHRFSKFTGVLCKVDRDGRQIECPGNTTASRHFKYQDDKVGDVYSQTGWETMILTRDGDCGAPLVAFEPQAPPPGKVIGVHVCGHLRKPQGHSVLVTRDALERLLAQFDPQLDAPKVVKSVDATQSVAQCRLIPKGKFILFDCVMPNKLCPSQPLKTTFCKTPFHDDLSSVLKSPKSPAHLRPFVNVEGVRVSPLAKALQKYGHDTIPMNYRNLNKITLFLSHYMRNKLVNHTGKRIFSTNEAVIGIPGVDFADRLNMRSSAGWPYQVLHKDQSGKAYLFDEDGNIVDPLLQYRVIEREAEGKAGKRVESLWRDCLKDELRPVSKVESGSTRLFTIAPVDFTIVLRKYFMDFTMAFYSAAGDKFFSAVGIDPESFDWTRLYNWLTEESSMAMSCDHSTYDGKLKPEAMDAVCTIINNWYNDSLENQLLRRTLFDELIHTHQLVENCMYSTVQGNPSGNPLTVVVNTIVNLIYILDAFLEIEPKHTLDDFFKYNRAIFYGDDFLITVNRKFKNFNQNSLIKYLGVQGLEVTPETKDNSTDYPDLRPIDEVTFLKRGFRRDPDFGKSFILSTIDKDTLISYLFWYRKAPDVTEQLQENMRAGLRFAAFHGRSFYNWYLNLWKKHMEMHKLEPIHISFEEQVDVYLANSGLGKFQALEKFMSTTNSKIVKSIAGIIQSPLYYICAGLGILSTQSDKEPTDDRWAVAIPSGEGKSYLAREFPHVFADHDELLLPAFLEHKSKLPWTASNATKYDFPPTDRRILLVHHPDNTNRKLIGSFIDHVPSYIRINILQRLKLKDPYVMNKVERNQALLQIAQKLEPQLFSNG